MQKTFDMPSGRKLLVTMAGFEDSEALLKAGLAEMKIGPEMLKAFSDKDLSDIGLTADLLDGFRAVVVSKTVDAALVKCFERCLYDGQHLKKSLFDQEEYELDGRRDWIAICRALIEVNVRPFFGGTFSGSKDQPRMKEAALK